MPSGLTDTDSEAVWLPLSRGQRRTPSPTPFFRSTITTRIAHIKLWSTTADQFPPTLPS